MLDAPALSNPSASTSSHFSIPWISRSRRSSISTELGNNCRISASLETRRRASRGKTTCRSSSPAKIVSTMRRPGISAALRTRTRTRSSTSAVTVSLKRIAPLHVFLIRLGAPLRVSVALCPKASLQCRSSLVLMSPVAHPLLRRKHQASGRTSKHDSVTVACAHLRISTASQCHRRSNSSLRSRPPDLCLVFHKSPTPRRPHRTIHTQPIRLRSGKCARLVQCGRRARAYQHHRWRGVRDRASGRRRS
jgi:hypothetical protein